MESSSKPVGLTNAEYAAFHKEDRDAASYILLILLGIFSVALVGYLVIAVWVAS